MRALPAEKRLVVSIDNPGAYRGRRAGGTGIDIVERRLALAYDGEAMLTIAAAGDTTRGRGDAAAGAAPPGSHT